MADVEMVRIPKHEYGHLLLAKEAAQLLVDAYKRAEDSHSVDWDDLDRAHMLAREAVDRERCAFCKAIKP